MFRTQPTLRVNWSVFQIQACQRAERPDARENQPTLLRTRNGYLPKRNVLLVRSTAVVAISNTP